MYQINIFRQRSSKFLLLRRLALAILEGAEVVESVIVKGW